MDDLNAPATKGDLAALEERVTDKMTTLEERLTAAMRAQSEQLIEEMRGMQTETLRAFYGYVESSQRRMTQQEQDTAALKDRLGILESRLMQIEKRLNMPPAA